MNISDIITKCYILALIVRDDGERLLLGDGFYEFTEQLQHFQPNTFQNDVIELQGTDGQLLAGQVRRGATQSFDGYIADSTASREATEEHRQRFLAFFRKKHHYKVVYVFPDGSAIKRERGYIVDAPSVPEMFQRFPEFHVGLNFEDVNYYEYEEGEDGEEIFAHVQNIAIAGYVEGGLIWDNYGAVSNEITWVDYALKNTTDGYAQITDGVLGAPLNLEQLFGNTTQQTYSGKNLMPILNIKRTINNVKFTPQADGSVLVNGTNNTANYAVYVLTYNTPEYNVYRTVPAVAGTYYISNEGTIPSGVYVQCFTQITGQSVAQKNADGVFTVAQNFDFGCAIRVDAGTTVNNLIIKPMLEKSSIKTSWEPYVGSTSSAITPSPNPDYPQAIKTVSGAQMVKITGKNLLNADRPSITYQGITYTNNGDGSIYFSGVSNQVSSYYVGAQGSIHLKSGQTYTISANNEGINPSVAVRLARIASQGGGVFATSYMTVANKSWQYTPTEDMDCTVEIRVPASFNISSGFTVKPQLELGSTATDFEVFQSQSYSINLGGTNLLDISGSAEQSGTTLKFENDEVKASGTASASITFTLINGIKYAQTYWQTLKPNDTNSILLPKGTYYFSGTYSIATTSVQYRLVDDGDTMENGTSVSLNSSFTVSSPKRFCIAVYVNNGNTPSGSFKLPQLNKGSTALPYAPYTDYAYELAKIGTYQDYIWNDGGTWKIHKAVGKIIFDGSESGWGKSGMATSNHFYYNPATALNVVKPADTAKGFTFSDNFCSVSLYDVFNSKTIYGVCLYNQSPQIRVAVPESVASTANAFTTWLASHPTTVYYALATPTDTKITDQTLIQQLSTIKALLGETNNVFLIPSGGAQGEMEVRYSRGFINQGAGYEWDAAQGGGPNILSVDGIDRTGFVWEVVGPATNPTLTNITTNQTMTFEGDVATGQTLTVNTSDQTAEIAGTNVFAQMEGEWMQLAPGNNVITYTATGATEPSKIKWNGVVG